MLAQTGLALVSLASFRSPFVGGLYGFVSALWLLTLLAAGSRTRESAVLWTLAFVACAVGNRLTPSPNKAPTTFWLTASGGIFVFVLAVNAWAVLRVILPPPSAAPESARLESARI